MLTINEIKQRLGYHSPRLYEQKAKRNAAVAMILRECNNATELLLIRRAEQEKDPWSGDLAFPGGKIEEQDSDARAAAERETLEETGIDLNRADFLGQSDDLGGGYLSVRVSCFVYHLKEKTTVQLNSSEVDDLFFIPLKTLLDPQRNHMSSFHYRGDERRHPVVDLHEWSQRPLWGLTYRMIDNFLALFDLSFQYSDKRA